MSLPYTALTLTEHKQKTPMTLQEFTPAEPAAHEVLIQNVAISLNNAAWKQIDWDFGIPGLPFVLGSDVAGTISKVGKDVKQFKVGDKVAAYMYKHTSRHGAFQTYSLANSLHTVKFPDTYTFEQASTIPSSWGTAAASLEAALGIRVPEAPFEPLPEKGEPLLVWGGSGSVGSLVIQIGKLAGYKVLTTASPRNFDYVKSLGADEVFDYHDPEVVNNIRKAAGPNLALAYDSIVENGSVEASIASITAPKGKVAIISPPPKDDSTDRVQVISTGIAAANNDEELGARVWASLAGLFEKAIIKPNLVEVVPGGLGGIDEGLQRLREGKVSGKKLVVRVEETKF